MESGNKFLYIVPFFQVDHCCIVPVLEIFIGINVVAALRLLAHHAIKVALPLVYDGALIHWEEQTKGQNNFTIAQWAGTEALH
jgi:hypothetical protein